MYLPYYPSAVGLPIDILDTSNAQPRVFSLFTGHFSQVSAPNPALTSHCPSLLQLKNYAGRIPVPGTPRERGCNCIDSIEEPVSAATCPRAPRGKLIKQTCATEREKRSQVENDRELGFSRNACLASWRSPPVSSPLSETPQTSLTLCAVFRQFDTRRSWD